MSSEEKIRALLEEIQEEARQKGIKLDRWSLSQMAATWCRKWGFE